MLSTIVTICVLPLLCFIVVGLKSAQSAPVEDIIQLYTEHDEKMKNFKCGTPMPRVLKVKELLPEEKNKLFYPECVVLHRCGDDTGCCPSGKICTKHSSEVVHLHFAVEYVGFKHRRHHSRASNPIEFESRSFVNHTKCGCEVPENLDHLSD